MKNPSTAPTTSEHAPRRTGHRRQSGQVLVLVVLMIVGLIGAVGLSIDIGNAVAHQRTDQGAADSAALAAGDRLANGLTLAAANSAGFAAANLAGVPSANLTLNYLDSSRNPSTDTRRILFVQATVNEGVSTFFMKAIGISTSNVAALAEVKYPKRCALCLLDTGASHALDISSSGNLTVSGDCLQVNSSAADALQLSSGGGVNAPCTNLVGGITGNPALVTPSANGGVPQVPDPLIGLPYPTGSMYDGRASTIAPGSTDMVINPGMYRQWALGGSGNLYLQPGTYVIVGPPSDSVAVSSGGAIKNCAGGLGVVCPSGLLNLTGPLTQLNPGGVTLFFTCDPQYNNLTSPAAGPICPCPGTFGSNMNISSNGGLQITAPTSGTYQGVAIFFDRCNTGSIAITANGGAPVTGAIYAKASAASITANGPLTVAGLFITATMQISGSGSVAINYDPTQANQKVNANWLKWALARLVT
jgi:hypothetical protein